MNRRGKAVYGEGSCGVGRVCEVLVLESVDVG